MRTSKDKKLILYHILHRRGDGQAGTDRRIDTGWQQDRKGDGQTHRQADKQKDRQTDVRYKNILHC
jgi:hypothetical protein